MSTTAHAVDYGISDDHCSTTETDSYSVRFECHRRSTIHNRFTAIKLTELSLEKEAVAVELCFCSSLLLHAVAPVTSQRHLRASLLFAQAHAKNSL